MPRWPSSLMSGAACVLAEEDFLLKVEYLCAALCAAAACR